MYRLKGWYIVGNIAYGSVSGNPKFPDAYPIHTSKIEDIEIDEENWEVVLHTLNSVYHCDLDSCKFDRFVYNKLADEKIDKIKSYKDKVLERYESKLPVDEDIALLEFNDVEYNIQNYMIRENGVLFIGDASVHLGMLQDSVLMDFNFRRGLDIDFDIRFFPYDGNRIEFYSWIVDRDVIIRNIGDKDLTIVESLIHNIPVDTGNIVIKPGEEKRFNKDGALVE